MQEQKSIISELIELSKVDGQISPDEIDLIKKMGNMIGLLDSEMLHLFKNPVPFSPSKDHTERITQFHRLVLLAKVDRIFSDQEKKHLSLLGIKMGLNPNAIAEILDRLSSSEDAVISPAELIGIYKKYMN
jgi:hypothetical protein